jgi:hypothetical protein
MNMAESKTPTKEEKQDQQGKQDQHAPKTQKDLEEKYSDRMKRKMSIRESTFHRKR